MRMVHTATTIDQGRGFSVAGTISPKQSLTVKYTEVKNMAAIKSAIGIMMVSARLGSPTKLTTISIAAPAPKKTANQATV
jgi:hypothetical protein